MASSILGAIFGTNPFTITNDDDFLPVNYAKELQIIGVEFLVSSAVTDHPISIGANLQAPDTNFVNLFDIDIENGKIIQPTKIRIKCMCSDLTAVERWMLYFIDTRLTFTITSKSIIADNMIMTDLTITQSTNSISASELLFEWEQAGLKKIDKFEPTDATNESTYGVRIQKPESTIGDSLSFIGDELTSAAKSLYNKVQGIISSIL